LLLFLAPQALGDTHGGPVDMIKYSHLEPVEPFWVELFTGYGGKTYALDLRGGRVMLLPNDVINYGT
jgi:hypothetical protein